MEDYKGEDGWCISLELYNEIKDRVKKGSTILEFGSGSGTEALSKYYKMISIEQDLNYMDQYESKYYHVLVEHGWFNYKKIRQILNENHYDAIVVDAPTKVSGGRLGMLTIIDEFKKVPMFFDDVQRPDELKLYKYFCKYYNRPEIIMGTKKQFGILCYQ